MEKQLQVMFEASLVQEVVGISIEMIYEHSYTTMEQLTLHGLVLAIGLFLNLC